MNKRKRGNPGVPEDEKRNQTITMYFTMLELNRALKLLDGEDSPGIDFRKKIVEWSKK